MQSTIQRSLFLILLVLACAAHAADGGPADPGGSTQAQGGGHRPPPPEALAACKALASGDACHFTSPHGNLEGTCWAPQGKPLACRPVNAPPPPEGQSRPSSGSPSAQ